MSKEMIEVYNDAMQLLGLKERSEVHKEGLLHRVVHCWGFKKEKEETWLYFQQRSFKKKDYPGLYDLLATGHIDAGEDITSAALRETYEEAGINMDISRLKYMGCVRQTTINDKINDIEMTNVFVYEIREEKFNINSEVERMVKIKAEDYKNFMSNNLSSVKAYTLNGESFSININEWSDKSPEYFAFIENYDFTL